MLTSFQFFQQREPVMKLQDTNFRNSVSPCRTGTLLRVMKKDENTEYGNLVEDQRANLTMEIKID